LGFEEPPGIGIRGWHQTGGQFSPRESEHARKGGSPTAVHTKHHERVSLAWLTRLRGMTPADARFLGPTATAFLLLRRNHTRLPARTCFCAHAAYQTGAVRRRVSPERKSYLREISRARRLWALGALHRIQQRLNAYISW
jgi:hypothetical protein